MTRSALYQRIPRTIDIENTKDLAHLLQKNPSSIRGWCFQSLDLKNYEKELASKKVRGSLFLGCNTTAEFEKTMSARGALLFPQIKKEPFNQYRADLYSYKELYNTFPYEKSYDANVYAWSRTIAKDKNSIDASLATTLHDHAMSDALKKFTDKTSSKIVGVMGGHDMDRGTEEYTQACELGKKLTQAGFIVATGGGPGAMEAANLGALYVNEDLQEPLKQLATVPNFKEGIDPWARVAYEVAEAAKKPGESLGIPTWFYGHEPPNMFATQIAKYFDNSIREATLLDDCKAGIIYLQGAAGTVQEIFQAACENYYASGSQVAPMILVGKKYWSEQYPAWQLLSALAKGHDMEEKIALVDSMDEALERIEQ
ncbi:MAG: LOG family protein [Micrococcaceae bacterium]